MTTKQRNYFFIGSILSIFVTAVAVLFGNGKVQLSSLSVRGSGEVENGTIVFSGSNTSVSGSNHNFTYTTNSTSKLGYPIRCVGTNFYSSTSNAVGYFQSSGPNAVLSFYDTTRSGEFQFENLKSITLASTQSTQRSLLLKFTTTESSTEIVQTININEKTGTYNFADLGYEVVTLKIAYTGSLTTTLSNITLTYNCSGNPRSLTGLSITTEASKTAYNAGETFNTNGMVITASYSDSTTKSVLDKCTYSTSALTKDDEYVEFSYTYRGTILSVRQNITVSEELSSETYSTDQATNPYFTLTLKGDSSGYFEYVNTSLEVTYTMHFTWSLSGSTYTFTKASQGSDSEYSGSTIFYRCLFGGSSTTNTGTISGTTISLYLRNSSGTASGTKSNFSKI